MGLNKFWAEITKEMTPFGKWTIGVLVFVISILIGACVFIVFPFVLLLRKAFSKIEIHWVRFEKWAHALVYRKVGT